MKKCIVVLINLFLFLGISHADTWSIRADSWCPYNCEPGSTHPGYIIEILTLAAKASGNTLDYKLMPWSRALDSARNGEITGVVGMSSGEREGLITTDVMGVDATCIFAKAGTSFKYSTIADLSKLRAIGTIQSYEYHETFAKWQKTNPAKIQSVAGENALKLNARKLKGERIDVFLENPNVLEYARKSIPELKDVISVGCLASGDLFAGISAKNSKAEEIKNAINAELAELKKSGELKKILTKYGVSGW